MLKNPGSRLQGAIAALALCALVTSAAAAATNCSDVYGGMNPGVSYPADLFSHVATYEWFYYKGTLLTPDGGTLGILLNVNHYQCRHPTQKSRVDAVVYAPPSFPYITASANTDLGATATFSEPATPLNMSMFSTSLSTNAHMSPDGSVLHFSLMSPNFRMDVNMRRMTINSAGIANNTACSVIKLFGRCFEKHLHSMMDTEATVWLKSGVYTATGISIEQHMWGTLPAGSDVQGSHAPGRSAARQPKDTGNGGSMDVPNWYWVSFNAEDGSVAFQGEVGADNTPGTANLFMGNKTIEVNDFVVHIISNWTSPISGRVFAQQAYATSSALGLSALVLAPPAQEIVAPTIDYFEGFADFNVTLRGAHMRCFGTMETVYLADGFDK